VEVMRRRQLAKMGVALIKRKGEQAVNLGKGMQRENWRRK